MACIADLVDLFGEVYSGEDDITSIDGEIDAPEDPLPNMDCIFGEDEQYDEHAECEVLRHFESSMLFPTGAEFLMDDFEMDERDDLIIRIKVMQ